MKYYPLWGTQPINTASTGRSYFSLFLILGIIVLIIFSVIYFAVIRQNKKYRDKKDELKQLAKLQSEGKITGKEFAAKRKEIVDRK
jgi:uncharacterized membrane protein